MKIMHKRLSRYEEIIMKLVKEYDGFNNAHCHLDRADTLDSEFLKHAGIDPFEASNLPLSVKQKHAGELHVGPAYTVKNLKKRMEAQLQQMIQNGTKQVTSLIDVTPDDIGMTAFEVALELKAKYAGKIDFRIGPQPIFGFKSENHPRWQIFQEAAKLSDVLGGLPEKDATSSRIGSDRHMVKVIETALELGKEAHIHTDQGNNPNESQTEDLVQAVRWLNSKDIGSTKEPSIWAVHALSTATYDEYRFKKLLDNLKLFNIGIICCPRAVVTMRQLRPIMTPTANSIIRLLHIIKWEIPVRLGTDNIADIFIPTGSNNLLDEIVYGADALRYSDPMLWAKIACGITPNDMDRVRIDRAFKEDHDVFIKIDPNWPQIERS